jgi:hypothetical protein
VQAARKLLAVAWSKHMKLLFAWYFGHGYANARLKCSYLQRKWLWLVINAKNVYEHSHILSNMLKLIPWATMEAIHAHHFPTPRPAPHI